MKHTHNEESTFLRSGKVYKYVSSVSHDLSSLIWTFLFESALRSCILGSHSKIKTPRTLFEMLSTTKYSMMQLIRSHHLQNAFCGSNIIMCSMNFPQRRFLIPFKSLTYFWCQRSQATQWWVTVNDKGFTNKTTYNGAALYHRAHHLRPSYFSIMPARTVSSAAHGFLARSTTTRTYHQLRVLNYCSF